MCIRDSVEFLFARYEELTAPLAPTAKPGRSRKKPIPDTRYTQADLDAGHIYAKEDRPPES
jgi:hypothetical protein